MSIRIGFCGGPSSGKTTLARALVNKLCMTGYNAEYVPEFPRHYINEARRSGAPINVTPLAQHVLLDGQMKWEEALPPTLDFVVSDSPVLIYLVYCYALTDWDDYNHVEFYHHYYRRFIEHRKRYDYLFYLPPVIEYTADGTRAESPERARQIGEKIKALLTFHDVPFHTVNEIDLEKRVDTCYKTITESDDSTEDVTT